MIRHRPKVIVLDDENDMANYMIKKWKKIFLKAIEKKGFFAVALSGGKTPIPLYQKLANLKDGLPWDKTHIFLVDERFVPFDDPDSNFRMLRATFLGAVKIPPENIHPIPVEELTPQMAAQKYEEHLKTFFKVRPGEFPEFDLILLGIGEDGHTASLFPGQSSRNELAAAVILDETRHARITLTLPVINSAENVIFLARGTNKAGIVEKTIYRRDATLPASMVNPKSGNLLFLLDLEASAQLFLRGQG